MAQSTILAAGQNRANSSDIVVAAGSPVSVGIFSNDTIVSRVRCLVMMRTPGDDACVGILNSSNPVFALLGPGTYRVERPDISENGVNVGVFLDT